MKLLLLLNILCVSVLIQAAQQDIDRYLGAYRVIITPKDNETDPVPGFLEKLPGYECSQQPVWPGETRFSFPCAPLAKSAKKPTSVHYLRPGDIDVIGALGDSLSAANGADACFLPELAYMYRGRCFRYSNEETFEGHNEQALFAYLQQCENSGADGSYATNPTLANILLKYNPDLKGSSLRTNWWTVPEAGFNVAIPGAVADDMPEQARAIIHKMKEEKETVDFDNDWKVVTLFIGGNDLCNWCDSNGVERPTRTPEAFAGYIEEALQILYDGMPRAFVNLVSVLQVHQVSKMTGQICDAFHYAWCEDGMVFPDETLAQTRRYHAAVRDMVYSGKFDKREDFAVVIQPFLEETLLPELENGEVDLSYFAPDCFHFSSKAHAVSGKELWNNMIQKVGEKSNQWDARSDELFCPTEEFPYLYTRRNSEDDFDITPPGGGSTYVTGVRFTTAVLVFVSSVLSS